MGSKSNTAMEAHKRVISAYERSEGEIGGPSAIDDITSLGEVRFPSNPKGHYSSQQRAGTPTPSTMMAGLKQRPTHTREESKSSVQYVSKMKELSETYNYEENKAMVGENEVDQPILDSYDGPVPKVRPNQGAGRGKADVFVSGESFGGPKMRN